MVDFQGGEYLRFPPNQSFFREVLKEYNCDVGEVIDLRALPKIEGLTTTITLRENQLEMLEKLEKFEYNGLITAKTGFGYVK